MSWLSLKLLWARFLGLPRPVRVFASFCLLSLAFIALRGRWTLGLPTLGLWSACLLTLVAALSPLGQGYRLRIFFAGVLALTGFWLIAVGSAYHAITHLYLNLSFDPFSKMAMAAAAPFALGLACDLERPGSVWTQSRQGFWLGLGFGPFLAGSLDPSFTAGLVLPALFLALAGSSLLLPGPRAGFSLARAAFALALVNLVDLLAAWHGHRLPEPARVLVPAAQFAALSFGLAPAPGRILRACLGLLLAVGLALLAKALGPDAQALLTPFTPAAMVLGWALPGPGLKPWVVAALALALAWPLSWLGSLAAPWLYEAWLRESVAFALLLGLASLPAGPVPDLILPIEREHAVQP